MRVRTFLAAAGVVALALVGAQAAAQERFGARLTTDTQPSGSEQGRFCRENTPTTVCSWVLIDAFQNEFPPGTDGHLAPRNGIISKIRIIACQPGTFVLQIGRAQPNNDLARVRRTGPLINYVGDSQDCLGDTFQIQTFNVNVPVFEGEYLGIVANRVSFLRCSSGGDNTFLYFTPLADGRPLRFRSQGEGCWLLLEAEYAPI